MRMAASRRIPPVTGDAGHRSRRPLKCPIKGSRTMSLFARAHYTSEITDFIEQMKQRKPTLEAAPRAGRALLWDKHLDRSLQEEYSQARVPQQPYVYQTRAK